MSVVSDLEANLTSAVAAAHKAQAALDGARKRVGLPPAPRSFYSRDDVLAEVAAALAAKPKKPLSEYEKGKLAQQAARKLPPQPVVHSASTAFASLDNVFNAIVEHQIRRASWVDVLAITRSSLDPQFAGAFTNATLMLQCRAAVARWFEALGLDAGETRMELHSLSPAPPAATAEVERPSADVLPMPSSALAKAIISAGKRARNEKEDT